MKSSSGRNMRASLRECGQQTSGIHQTLPRAQSARSGLGEQLGQNLRGSQAGMPIQALGDQENAGIGIPAYERSSALLAKTARRMRRRRRISASVLSDISQSVSLP